MRNILLTAIFLFAFSAYTFAGGLAIGSTMEGFSMPDVNGKVQSLDQLKGTNGTVVIFVSSQCPVVKGYNDRINAVAADYAAKGIAFIGINSNVTEMKNGSAEPLDWVKTHTETTFNFPVLFDKGSELANKLGANVTPEIFYIDTRNVLLYHGAIDNDRSGRNPTDLYLRTAFDLSLAGKKIERPSVNAFGCTIKREQ